MASIPHDQEHVSDEETGNDYIEDTSYIVCCPGTESTHCLPWHDPAMVPFRHDRRGIPVYRWNNPYVVEGNERMLVYQGEHLVGNFPTNSLITMSHYCDRYFYVESRECQYEFIFDKRKDANAASKMIMSLPLL